MEQPNSTNKKALAIVGLLVIVAVIGVGVFASNQKKNADTVAVASPMPSAQTSPSTSASPAVESESTTAGAYKDGTYSAVGSYVSPGGQESITINLTVKDGSVTDTSAVAGSTNPTGQSYQGQFINGYKASVVGKKLDEIQLTKVSGSSLTPKGFNDALSQIKSKAKA